LGRHIQDKSEAKAAAEEIRTSIRNGKFRAVEAPLADTSSTMSFAAFSDHWAKLRGVQLVRPKDNEYRLKKIKAFVILNDGATTTSEELVAWGKEQMANYKYPRIVEIVPSLPMTATGKILKRELS